MKKKKEFHDCFGFRFSSLVGNLSFFQTSKDIVVSNCVFVMAFVFQRNAIFEREVCIHNYTGICIPTKVETILEQVYPSP